MGGRRRPRLHRRTGAAGVPRPGRRARPRHRPGRPSRRRAARRPPGPARGAGCIVLARPRDARPRRPVPATTRPRCSPPCGTSCGPARSPTTRSRRCGPSSAAVRPAAAAGSAALDAGAGRGPGPVGSAASARRRAPVAGRSSNRCASRCPNQPAATPTEVAHARANQLLERYGVLTREAALGEGIEGGFAGVYPVLKALEERGNVRRGYFVAGLGAAQFAVPGCRRPPPRRPHHQRVRRRRTACPARPRRHRPRPAVRRRASVARERRTSRPGRRRPRRGGRRRPRRPTSSGAARASPPSRPRPSTRAGPMPSASCSSEAATGASRSARSTACPPGSRRSPTTSAPPASSTATRASSCTADVGRTIGGRQRGHARSLLRRRATVARARSNAGR